MAAHTHIFLRRLRIAVAVTYVVALCLGITDYVAAFTPLGQRLAHVQILPALAVGNALWLAMWCTATFVLGRIYCSTVCPMGTLMDVFGRLGHSRLLSRLSHRPRRVYRYAAPRSRLRLSFLLAMVVLLVAGWTLVASLLDPFDAFVRMLSALGLAMNPDIADMVCRLGNVALSAAIAAVTFVAVATVAALQGRTICNTICPIGTALGAISTRAIVKMDINTDRCTNCRRCEYVCKAHCIDLDDHVVDTSRCVVCFDCTAACPDGAISYRTGRHTLSDPLLQPTTNQIKPTVNNEAIP